MFAGRAAAEIITGDEDIAVPGGGIVERKLLAHLAVLVVAQVVEQRVAEALTGCRREKTRRHDLVRIDITNRQDDRSGVQGSQCVHCQPVS